MCWHRKLLENSKAKLSHALLILENVSSSMTHYVLFQRHQGYLPEVRFVAYYELETEDTIKQ